MNVAINKNEAIEPHDRGVATMNQTSTHSQLFQRVCLANAGNDSPLPPNLVLPEPLHVPLLPIHRPRQHGCHLIEDKCQCGPTCEPTRDIKPKPLNPLGKVVRVQHVPEQARLGDLVVLAHRAGLGACLLLRQDTRLTLLLAAANLAQLLVVVVVGGQAQVEEGEAGDELGEAPGVELGGPLVLGGGAVGGEPATDAEGVAELEGDGGEPDEDVDGGHGGLEEGEEDGAVEVVHYVEAGEDLVLPWQVGDALLGGERTHGVQQREEARALHGEPGDAAG